MIRSRLICVASLVAVSAIVHSTTAWAVPLSSALFNHQYNGNTYGNPGLSGTNSSFTEIAGENGVWSPSTDGDIFSFRNTLLNATGYFQNDEWASTVDDSVGWTIEFRVKIGADFDDDPEFGAFQVFAKEDGSSNSTRRASVNIGQDFVYIGTIDTTPIDTSDNTDDFHVFRIAQPANSSNITVWRDGVEIFNDVSKTGNNSGVNMYFGDASFGIGGPTVELDYFRWDSTGAYEPVPEPHGLALAAFGAIGAAAWIRRRRRSA